MAVRRGYMARRIQRAFRRYRGRKAMAAYGRKGRMIRRQVGLGNPSPTFTETFKSQELLQVIAGGPGAGKTFKVRISDIPQTVQYFNLYKQYRINWVKVMLLPKLNTEGADPNIYTTLGAGAAPLPAMGMARIVYSIQDSPGVNDPVNEAEVLQENGCKIKAFKSKWSCSFKPVPDVASTVVAGAGVVPVYARQKFRQWFNWQDLAGNNPLHGGVSAWITLPGTQPGGVQVPNDYYIYYKVNFSLRDPI